MRRFLLILAIALVVAAAAGAGALAVRTLTGDDAPAVVAPTKAQLAARKRLADELATYGCACQHHQPPAKIAPTTP